MGSGHRPVTFLTVLLLLSVASSDLDADRAALLSLRAAVARSLLPTWSPSASPCSYQGVACAGGRVASLRLPGAGLLGSIPAGTLGNLTALRILSLRFNALSGPLPSDLLSLPELRNLYLQQNRLSGAVPAAISGLKNLVRLNLARNNFSGNITASLSALPRLRTLFLESNSFSGALPDLDLPNLVQFNVSFNSLNGSIPPSLQKMPSDAFLGMSVCGGPLQACPGDLSPSPSPASAPSPGGGNGGSGGGSGAGGGNNKSHKKKKLSSGAIAGISVASAVALGMVVLVFVLLCTKRSSKNAATSTTRTAAVPKPQERAVAVSAAAAAAPPPPAGSAKKLVFFGEGGKGEFDLEDLLRASAEVLGKGTFGTAYKAVLETGLVVAVKRLKDVTMGEREFREKVERVGAMNHPNLVPLKAYYFSKDEKLMVYEYMPLGSLSALLHGNRGSGSAPLNWEIRSAIALVTARGLAYIHSTGLSSSHGNIKSSNILLGKSNVDARVSDHGLAQLAESSSSSSSSSSMPARAAGYRAPEVTDPRRVSQEADVYSFGVLLLELLTGKAPAQAVLNEEGTDLPRWVQSVVREEWASEVFDAELLRNQKVEEEMVQLLQLAVDCAAQYPDSRPSMAEVVGKIEDIRQSSLRVAAVDGDENESRRTHSFDGSKPDGGDH